jgi:hypothetical protein
VCEPGPAFSEPEGSDTSAPGFPRVSSKICPLISGIGNLLSSIKFEKYYGLTGRDIILTVLTDSMELYGTRVEEMRQARGDYTQIHAAGDYHRYLMGEGTENMLELSNSDRKRIHNLKYFTWIEQQKKSLKS